MTVSKIFSSATKRKAEEFTNTLPAFFASLPRTPAPPEVKASPLLKRVLARKGITSESFFFDLDFLCRDFLGRRPSWTARGRVDGVSSSCFFLLPLKVFLAKAAAAARLRAAAVVGLSWLFSAGEAEVRGKEERRESRRVVRSKERKKRREVVECCRGCLLVGGECGVGIVDDDTLAAAGMNVCGGGGKGVAAVEDDEGAITACGGQCEDFRPCGYIERGERVRLRK